MIAPVLPITPVPPLRPASQQALALTGRDYLSWSQVSQMMNCPYKFQCQYVLQSPPAFMPESLAFGIAFHQAVEEYYIGRLEGQPRVLLELWSILACCLDQYATGEAPPQVQQGSGSG